MYNFVQDDSLIINAILDKITITKFVKYVKQRTHKKHL